MKLIMDKINIINGDCIEVMRTIGDNTVDLILCDPPVQRLVRGIT